MSEAGAPGANNVEPGWYPDPDNADQLRWWTGADWGRIKGRVNRLAVAALAFAWFVPVGGPPAIVLGVLALQEIDDFGGERGRGIAIWAVVVGAINLTLVIAGVVLLVLSLAHGTDTASAHCAGWEHQAGVC